MPGYGAVALADSTFAPDLIAAVRADLVILDIDLPGLSGLELYDRLRERPETADIPVLFMSAAAHREELARRGIYVYLHKPFDLDDLLARVDGLLAEPRWRDERPPRATGTRPE